MKSMILPVLALLLALPAFGQGGNDLPVDAFGRSVDVAGQFAQVLEQATGSASAAAYAMGMIGQTETWERYLRTAEPEVHCSAEYKKAHPGKTVEEYEAFRATEAGTAEGNACFRNLVKGHPQGQAYLEGHLASFELALIVPFFQGLGPPEGIDPSPETRQNLQKILNQLAAFSKCVASETYKKIGLEKLVDDPQSFYAASDEAASGACKPLADLLPQ